MDCYLLCEIDCPFIIILIMTYLLIVFNSTYTPTKSLINLNVGFFEQRFKESAEVF